MHAVVTGAGGFVGAAVARHCLEVGLAVTAVYRKNYPTRLPTHSRLAIVSTDLRRCEGLPTRYDYLFHCAADVPAACPDSDELLSSNVEGTSRVFQHAAEAGARCVVFMSSMAVYGDIRVSVVDEDTSPHSPSVYGSSKAEGESLLRDWAERTAGRAVAIRLPGVVGAGGRNNFLCDTLQRVLSDDTVKARNPDALFNNLMHVEDLAAFVVGLLQRMPTAPCVLTIAARDPLSIRSVLSRLYAATRRTENIIWGRGGVPFLIAYDRALSLGYRPATVADSLDRFVADVLAAR